MTRKKRDAWGWESRSLEGAQGGGPGNTPRGRAGGPQGLISKTGPVVAAQSQERTILGAQPQNQHRERETPTIRVGFNQLMQLNPSHPC